MRRFRLLNRWCTRRYVWNDSGYRRIGAFVIDADWLITGVEGEDVPFTRDLVEAHSEFPCLLQRLSVTPMVVPASLLPATAAESNAISSIWLRTPPNPLGFARLD